MVRFSDEREEIRIFLGVKRVGKTLFINYESDRVPRIQV
jgi:hypothetical protein